MTDRLFGILDGALVLVVVLGLCAWQLVSINREIAKDKRRKADVPESVSPESVSQESSGHPIGEHRLDDR